MRIYPSVLSADFGSFASELLTISSADAAHIDVMDNHFVPNLTFGLPVVERLQQLSPIPLDVHLMIEEVDTEALKYAEIGVESVTYHLEASKSPVELSRELRKMGTRVAAAIKPATEVSSLRELLPELDMVLIMTVEPGFGGQKLIQETLQKVSAAREMISSSGLQIALQVDGGVTEDNIGELAELGADVFVAGTAVFGGENREERILALRDKAISHAHR